MSEKVFYKNYVEWKDESGAIIRSRKNVWIEKVPIDKIYISHSPMGGTNEEQAIDQYHRDGIEMVKKLIQAGDLILPILTKEYDPNNPSAPWSAGCDERYSHIRLDGFKRLIAYRELGYTEVECLVDTEGMAGGQDGNPWVGKHQTK
jgi:hypothetical protein